MDLWLKFESSYNATNYTNLSYLSTQAPKQIDFASRMFTVIQFSIIGSAGIMVNIMPVAVTALGYVKRNVVNAMVVNLSCCELMLCISFVFGQLFFVLWREWLNMGWCHFLSFIHFVAAFASFMFPPLLAINRYVALYRESYYDRCYSKKKTVAYMTMTWSFCSVVPMIFLIAHKTGYDEDNDHCCMVVKDASWIALYWLIIIFPLLSFCDGIMIYCNYKIYKKLKKHAESTVSIATNVVRDNRELLYFLLADMMFPICFHSTYHIFKFILVNRTSEFLKRFFISLYLVNSILRGAVTIIMLRPYRRAVVRMLCGKKIGSAVHPATTGANRSTAVLRDKSAYQH